MAAPKRRYVQSYLADSRNLGAEDFLAKHRDPVLVVLARGEEEEGEYVTYAGVTPEAMSAIAAGRRMPPAAEVFPVKKTCHEATFPGMITIGRTINCDLVILDPKISKFHAYLVQDPKDRQRCLLADAGSRNGTFLNGTRLKARRLTELTSGDEVRIGSRLLLRFYQAEAFLAAISAT